jgi:hypothetical protein
VALGASIVAAELDPDAEAAATSSVLIDVTGHTLSVAALNEHRQLELEPIIRKETQIPCHGSHRFSSMGHFQSTCRIEVYQGEGTRIDPEKVTMIGAFTIDIAPIETATPLDVALDLNASGLLVAHATDELSGSRVSCKMDYRGSARMSPEELARRKEQLQRQLHDVIAQTANPLAAPAGGPQGPAPAPPVPPGAAFGRAGGFGAPAGQAAPPPADPASLMNPILRAVYQKAISSFARIPADRQNAVVDVVSAIEAAAMSGDAQKVNSYLPQQSRLLEGVS